MAALNQGLFGQNSFGEINSRTNFSNNTLNNSTDYVDQKMGGLGQLVQGEMVPGMRAAQGQNRISFGIGPSQARTFQSGAANKRSPTNGTLTPVMSPTLPAKATLKRRANPSMNLKRYATTTLSIFSKP